MIATPIDVWNVATFDQGINERLRGASDLIRKYFETDRRQQRERTLSHHCGPPPSNPFAAGFLKFQEELSAQIADRTIRAWHYTRLMDDEADAIIVRGAVPSTLETIKARLDRQVGAGLFPSEMADALFTASPFHGSQHDARAGKFWLTSLPRTIDDGGVELLLSSWGGEAVYFWQDDEMLQAQLATLGRPRVIEAAVPLALTNHRYDASCALVASFARTLGCQTDTPSFDLYVTQPLGPEAILAVHSEGDMIFDQIGRGYPTDFASDI